MKVNCRSARSQVFRDGGYSYCHIDMLRFLPTRGQSYSW
ncbi:hypothetical protein NC652_020116 [Populus alba x Populus x berolinensis]|uniref:Uncharacterized protein n=1 Tax=Populus alba x Populus x berolinensis TaxID=444605 RepID=A0AAD6MJ69_9ROSI|nr:hypothetical protein NC652_020087 [Populus alba x Populus x berolinensis]KAJ6909048.1 hypothetical protein NC652_020116 [Populus alba x Populus x berolinensis]KAJ6986554.1 hypothetical protein NC653_019924 [Populus alba x Populus x berolinensis]KAJ6986584.1 hypothetical protein NC653_019950 [Populus alba x Populus x berolinensis]